MEPINRGAKPTKYGSKAFDRRVQRDHGVMVKRPPLTGRSTAKCRRSTRLLVRSTLAWARFMVGDVG
jgi:hypothetical protein